MTFSFQQSGETGVLTFKGALTIEDAAELKSVIADALATSTGLVVDAAEIESTDLSCLQLLCSAHRSAVGAGKSLEILNSGGEFAAVLRAAGYCRNAGCLRPSCSDCLWIETN